MLRTGVPALVFAPMDGITDAPMRNLQGTAGAFTYAVSEFIRVSSEALPARVFLRDVPELGTGAQTTSGLPVQVQLLGGDPGRMAESAMAACRAGATAIDINFGCPAPIVNRHDGGASLLRSPFRIREVVSQVRAAVPPHVSVSAKLRLGWDSIEPIHENAAMAVEGGASWITIHARTRVQGYSPPVFWTPIRRVRESLGVPVVANGDIWTLDDFRQCRDETGCDHFMIGRGALADPWLARAVACELGIAKPATYDREWIPLLWRFVECHRSVSETGDVLALMRLKQWLKIARNFGGFPHFDAVKQTASIPEFFSALARAQDNVNPPQDSFLRHA